MRRNRLLIAAAAVVAATLALAGCAGSGTPESSSTSGQAASSAGYPVKIADAFGTTTIDKKPERVVAWGYGSADALLALGTVPVAIPAQTYGGDKDGVLPWIKLKLKELGAKTPAVLPNNGTTTPVQQIIAQNPDLVLAPYSGITKKERDQLTAVGIPVVAYPDKAWSTPWQDVITITGKALGEQKKAKAVLAGIDAQIAAAAAKHPEFKGKTVAQVWDTAGTFYVYLPADPRVQFTEQLGFVTDPAVKTLDSGESTFYATVSPEKIDALAKADILVTYADNETQLKAFTGGASAKLLPQVAKGALAAVVGQARVTAVSPPTALSLTWGLNEYVDQLAKAVAASGK
jgi:iron complex transport system substrate-binding protein